MKKLFGYIPVVLTLAALVTPTTLADEADALSGKWTLKRANDQGQTLTRVLEIKKNKFTFSMMGADDKIAFYAEGDIKLEKLGPFNSLKFVNMKIGQSPSDTQAFDEERAAIYQLEEGTLTMASNFDAERNQKPSLDVYTKVAATATAAASSNEAKTLIIDKVVMHQTPQVATWFFCFEAKTDGAMQRYRVPNQNFDKDGVTIQMDLKVPNVRAGQTCTFKCQLDDVEDDVCTDDIDNTSSGKFTTSESGSQEYKPEDRWRYTVYWHLK
ncbi:MAG: hypothetical protein HY298_24940 [Verrucomicrobia bacterium]|nr:hypothetical protein [Verrucomicrobiota bacterium]